MAYDSSQLRWHYTTGDYLTQILESQVIHPATIGVPEGEKPCVWFSTHPEWEQTANKAVYIDGVRVPCTKDQTHMFGGGLKRIGVAEHTAPHAWRVFKRLSGASSKVATALYSQAIVLGAKP